MWLADHFKIINNSVPTLLNAVNVAHKVRPNALRTAIRAPRRFQFDNVGLWWRPGAAAPR